MKQITVGTGFEWDSKWGKVGIHAIVEHLLTKKCLVDWYVHPVSPLFFLKPINLSWKYQWLKRALQGTISYKVGDSVLDCHGMIAPFHPIRQIPVLNSYSVANNYWKFATIGHTFRCPKPESDILLFDSGGVCMFSAFASKATLTIYRLNDLAGEFPTTPRGIGQCEEHVLRNADLILAVSEPLYHQAVSIRGTSEGVHWLPNGVNIEKFLEPQVEPADLSTIPRPRAIFVGSISQWVDWDLLLEVARLRPSISFCIIGSGESRIPNDINNVHLFGNRPSNTIPAYLQHSDVGLIPFRNMPLTRKIERPLKFYEYIASGLPVVTVPFGSMSAMSPIALLAETPEEFASAIDAALAYKLEQKQDLQKIAHSYSWKHIFIELDQILTRSGFSL